jgi:hypothetical protein
MLEPRSGPVRLRSYQNKTKTLDAVGAALLVQFWGVFQLLIRMRTHYIHTYILIISNNNKTNKTNKTTPLFVAVSTVPLKKIKGTKTKLRGPITAWG